MGSLFLISIKSFGTAQVPDYLIIDKDTLHMQSNPLEEYFRTHPFPDNLITKRSSGNWRGYIAYFKFLDGKLVVENIYKEDSKINNDKTHDQFLTSIYKEVFGSNINFYCDYYSGLLVCPFGKMIEYVHMGYSSLYENYNLIEIKNGVNVKSKKLTGEEFKDFKIRYFKYFKKTEEYRVKAKEFKDMMLEMDRSIAEISEDSKSKKKENKYLKQKENEYRADKELDSFMFVFLSDYIKTIEIPQN